MPLFKKKNVSSYFVQELEVREYFSVQMTKKIFSVTINYMKQVAISM